MGSFATLVQSYAGISNQVRYRDEAAEVLSSLQAIAREVAQAVEVTEPAPGSFGTATQLRLRRLDAETDTIRLPRPLPTPPSLIWDPYPADGLLDVLYENSPGSGLTRTVAFEDGSSSSLLMTSPIQGFACRWEPSGGLEITASVATETVLVRHRVLAGNEVLIP